MRFTDHSGHLVTLSLVLHETRSSKWLYAHFLRLSGMLCPLPRNTGTLSFSSGSGKESRVFLTTAPFIKTWNDNLDIPCPKYASQNTINCYFKGRIHV